jgi:dolichol-phosphate mannosyltransferase
MEPLIHFTVPFVMLVLLGLSPKKALPLALLALAPDFDVLFLVHRSLSHSIPVYAAVFLPPTIMAHVMKRGMRTCVLAFSALASHTLLDTFSGATPLFWPVYRESLWIETDLTFHIGSSINLIPTLALATEPTTFQALKSFDAPLLTGEGLVISLTLLTAMLLGIVMRRGSTVTLTPPNIVTGPNRVADPEGPAQMPALRGGNVSPEHVTIVIPTLNEAEAIGTVIDELKSEGYDNILVVDGYSTDKTVEIARERGVKVIYQRGAGKAGAIRTAIEVVDTPFMVLMDGDGTYDARDIKRLLSIAPEYDEVIGLRMDRHNIPPLHRLGNRIISTALSLLMGRRLNDPCSCMYVLKTDSVRNLELTSKGFAVEAEIAAQLSNLGKVAEIPISYRRRIGRRKLQSWKDGFNILVTVFKMAWLYNPVFLLSAIAALLAVPGALILIWQLYIRYVFGAERWSLGWAWLGLVLLVIGLQGFTLATISLLLKRVERRILRAVGGKSG